MVKNRQLNFELLRVFSMMLVLLFHANFWSIGEPCFQSGLNVHDLIRTFLESLCMPCVNLFIMISGWFGINPTVRGLSKFLFQCIFISVLIEVVFVFTYNEEFGINSVREIFYLSHTDYFVKSYILLFLFSPILNTFVEYNNEVLTRKTLFALGVFVLFLGWICGIGEGGRLLDFCFYYLTARFLNKFHPNLIMNLSKAKLLIYYIIASIALTLLYVCPNAIGLGSPSLSQRYWSYISPFCMVQTIVVFLLFAKILITPPIANTNSFISRICVALEFFSSSCFAVYLININYRIQPLFKEYFYSLHNNFTFPSWCCLVIISTFVFFLICVLLDKLRITCWNLVSHRI